MDGLYAAFRNMQDMVEPKPLRANVNRCPRCGGSHERVRFEYRPSDHGHFTHVGACPAKAGAPIFFKRTSDKGAKLS